MAAGLPDLINCTRLAADAVAIERMFELKTFPRLKDLLAEPAGVVYARFAFAELATGSAGARVTVQSRPALVCQRCMQGFFFEVNGTSEIEFAVGNAAQAPDSEREYYETAGGSVRLSELAEEELLLALPIAPACANPLTCGNAPGYVSGGVLNDAGDDTRRPFSSLQDLLKKL